MTESTSKVLEFPCRGLESPLEGLLREQAVKLLAMAIETEARLFVSSREHLVDSDGRKLVVRNGYLPERTIQTSLGEVPVHQPRVRDRRSREDREVFRSALLPPYLRRTKTIEDLIPWLYLKGISTGDFAEALQALVGPQAKGLSASSIVRMKEIWEAEHQAWAKRSLQGRRYVYVWADGIHFNVRLESPESKKQCILVLIGATADGTKEFLAVQDGYQESEESWWEILLDLKQRGLAEAPRLLVGDGALGLWAAANKIWPEAAHQRCWVHKTGNVLNRLPKSVRPRAKSHLQDIWRAESRKEALKAFDEFVALYRAKHPKAVECLEKDRDELMAFYDFPAHHWIHLRTTNPIESSFATVRLRTRKTKGCGSRAATLAMVFRLGIAAQRTWRPLNSAALTQEVAAGIVFVDGIKKAA